jgi:flagellum-specific peptidoglycan hydrolase FlgJ
MWARSSDNKATAAGDPSPTASASQRGAVSQAPSNSPANGCVNQQHPVVVLDAGDSGGSNYLATAEVDGPTDTTGKLTDPVTHKKVKVHYRHVDLTGSGVETLDTRGAEGEIHTVWMATMAIRDVLVKHGYIVVLTKKHESDDMGLLTRAQLAEQAHAAIAITLRYSGPPDRFGVASKHLGVTPQQVGEYRENEDNSQKLVFTNAATAARSLLYAQKIQVARAAAGDPMQLAQMDFAPHQGLPTYGNIPSVSLAAQTVPLVYIEDGPFKVGTKEFDKYVTGNANGIMQAVPAGSCLATATPVPSITSSPPTSAQAAPIPGMSSSPERSEESDSPTARATQSDPPPSADPSGTLVERPASQLPDDDPQGFIDQIHHSAETAMQQTGVPASIIIAQAMRKSRDGTTVLATKAHNLFQTACGQDDKCVSYHPIGHSVVEMAKYRDWDHSMMAFAKLLKQKVHGQPMCSQANILKDGQYDYLMPWVCGLQPWGLQDLLNYNTYDLGKYDRQN